jgi:AcrR family transcriptional regulator
MARVRPEDGFARLIEAGLTVFSRRGVHATRIADVAREMGVSPATIYLYVESKEALLYVLIDHGLDTTPPRLPASLPIRTPDEAQLLDRLRSLLQASSTLPELEAAAVRAQVDDPRAEAWAVIGELYDLTARTRRWVDLLQRSAEALPELGGLFLIEVRRRVFATMTQWVQLRMDGGTFRRRDPVVTGRFVIETVTYFARHRHRDLDPATLPVEDEALRQEILALVVDGLLA